MGLKKSGLTPRASDACPGSLDFFPKIDFKGAYAWE